MKYALEKVLDRIENYHIFNEKDTFQIKITPIKENTRMKLRKLAYEYRCYLNEQE